LKFKKYERGARKMDIIALEKINKEERLKLLDKEWDEHKWRKGEYYDKFLYKLLDKYDLSLDDYYESKGG